MRAIIIDRILLPAAAFAALFALRCADLSGGGSEAGNARVIGRVMNVQGSPAGNVMVRVIPSDYDPVKRTAHPDSVFDTTGTDGRYGFTVPKGRTYTIQAVHMTLRTRALVAGVAVVDTDITVPPCTLNAPGAIKVMLPDSADKTLGYIYVPGTAVLTFLNNAAGFVVLDSVPAGVIPAVSYSSINIPASAVIRYNVPVGPGDTTVVYHPSWKYARRLFLNTTTGGANVSGDVYNFPVLVRLIAGNFTFAEAKADGGDLRFTKADGSPLPYELARWDAANGFAEVWVKVDTVRRNNGAQYIIMFWGNPSAGSASSGAAVFDSSGGFEGVWHLNETSGTRARDASRNGFSGTYRGGLPRGEPGPSGICQNIERPDNDYVDMGNVLNPGTKDISVGVWVKPAAFGLQQALIAKTNGDGPSATYGYLLSIDLFNLPHFYLISGGATWGDDGTFDVSGNLAITDSAVWHHVFIAVDRSDNGLCKMYVDGIDRTGTIRGNVSRVADVANALRLRVGTENDDNYSFKGAIGEATVAFTARSADWVKLSYMNQKSGDRLVVFGKE
jgi:hypothetical protein